MREGGGGDTYCVVGSQIASLRSSKSSTGSWIASSYRLKLLSVCTMLHARTPPARTHAHPPRAGRQYTPAAGVVVVDGEKERGRQRTNEYITRILYTHCKAVFNASLHFHVSYTLGFFTKIVVHTQKSKCFVIIPVANSAKICLEVMLD